MRKAFTLIELLVVIVIIGVLATLAVVAISSARTKARDAKRISDLKQISTALEMYHADYTAYPNLITPGQPLVSEDGTKTYMAKVPNNPTPRAEGACADLDYQYSAGNDNYSLIGCLSKAVGDVPAGARKMEKGGQPRDLGPTNGLVGWWMLDGINGTKDLSGNGVNGSILGGAGAVVTSTGRFGEANGAYSFDGSSGFVNTTNSLAKEGDLTMSCWFNAANLNGYPYIFNAGIGGTTYTGAGFILYPNGQINFNWRYGTAGVAAGNSVFSTTLVELDAWYQVVATVVAGNPATVKLYMNGDYEKQSTDTEFNLVRSAGPVWTIGKYWGSNTNYFNGKINECRLYNRALSGDEVSALYEATKP